MSDHFWSEYTKIEEPRMFKVFYEGPKLFYYQDTRTLCLKKQQETSGIKCEGHQFCSHLNWLHSASVVKEWRPRVALDKISEHAQAHLRGPTLKELILVCALAFVSMHTGRRLYMCVHVC